MFSGYLDQAFKDRNLSKLDVEIYWRLRTCQSGYAKNQRVLTQWTGKNSGTISKSIKRLEDYSYITIQDHKIIPLRLEFEDNNYEPSSRNQKTSSRKENTSSRNQETSSGKDCTIYIKHKENINKTNNTSSPSKSFSESDKKIEKEYINIPELPLVKITEKEKESLKKHYNDDLMFLKAVRFFNEYLEDHPEKVTGKKAYKNHSRVLKGWVYEKFLKLDILEKQYVKTNAQFDDYINRKKDSY